MDLAGIEPPVTEVPPPEEKEVCLLDKLVSSKELQFLGSRSGIYRSRFCSNGSAHTGPCCFSFWCSARDADGWGNCLASRTRRCCSSSSWLAAWTRWFSPRAASAWFWNTFICDAPTTQGFPWWSASSPSVTTIRGVKFSER
jgi:hypothetical protein